MFFSRKRQQCRREQKINQGQKAPGYAEVATLGGDFSPSGWKPRSQCLWGRGWWLQTGRPILYRLLVIANTSSAQSISTQGYHFCKDTVSRAPCSGYARLLFCCLVQESPINYLFHSASMVCLSLEASFLDESFLSRVAFVENKLLQSRWVKTTCRRSQQSPGMGSLGLFWGLRGKSAACLSEFPVCLCIPRLVYCITSATSGLHKASLKEYQSLYSRLNLDQDGLHELHLQRLYWKVTSWGHRVLECWMTLSNPEAESTCVLSSSWGSHYKPYLQLHCSANSEHLCLLPQRGLKPHERETIL